MKAGLTAWIVSAYFGIGWSGASVIAAAVLGGLGAAWLSSTLRARCWWLVPGGLICRRHHAWRRELKVSLFTPANTPLLLNMKTNIGMVVCGGEVWSFPFHASAGWAIIAGWISTSRPTTEQEALAFVGPDAVPVQA